MRRKAAFSLLEVLLVLVIVGVLGSMAYPSYAAYLLKTRRAEGQMALLHRMQDEERYFTDHHRYLAFGADAGGGDAQAMVWWSGADAQHSAYELRGKACPGAVIAECIVIEAAPGTERVNAAYRDPECGTLSLNSVGVRTASGPAGRCWP
ncbi:MAG TPA: type IV pilin protein [Telluria sp.]|nr:type IV pilin protein [Telluria sp.]